MTEQEQIEQMAEDLENTILGLGIHLCEKSAEKLYDLGYRKLPEDSIVLSREESQALKKQIEYWEYETKVAREEIDNAGKETAKEILNELIDSSNKITFFDCRMALGLDKLAKQYGVEVKE